MCSYFFISNDKLGRPLASRRLDSSIIFYNSEVQKQPLVVFCKKRCSWKFRKTHGKTPAPESCAEACNFIKKETLTQMLSKKLCETFKNNFFTDHLRATASGGVFETVSNICGRHFMRK